MNRRVLLVEDNHDLCRLIALHLQDIGCEVTAVTDGNLGLDQATSGNYGLIVLDLMLPGVDGLEICRRTRAAADYTPILMLTAKSSELDRVTGLESGADDYLTKPFSILELVARVKALFRRVRALSSSDREVTEAQLAVGDLTIEIDRRLAKRDGVLIDLTKKEFDLLAFFARHPGRVFSRSQLLDHVWGYGHAGYEHTVNSHINRLRAKLETDPHHPQLICTVWGAGYKLADVQSEKA